jgi:hypothetical protein
MSKIALLDEQQLRPRVANGIDWSRAPRVLATNSKRELWWRPGFTGWICLGQSGYHAAVLYLVDLGNPHMANPLQEGGRLGRPMFQRHAQAIDEFFGQSVAEHLHPRKTVKVG